MHGLTEKLRDPKWLREEFWRLFKYGIVGLASTGIFLGVYALFSRLIWTTANKTLLDGIAMCVSAVFNFTMHRIWTFEAGNHDFGMIIRYFVTVSLSAVIQTALFHIGNGILGFNDFFVQIILVPFIAAVSYVINRQFTFSRRYKKASESALPAVPEAIEIAAPVEMKVE
jgi:putative flippase GtrA